MSEEPNMIDELERRLIATYYEGADQPVPSRWRQGWLPAAGSVVALATLAVVVVLVLLPGSVNPPAALAALDRAADAATRTATATLGPGKLWYARTIQTSRSTALALPRVGQPNSSAPSSVPATFRYVSEFQITRNGPETDRTTSTASFVDPSDAKKYRPISVSRHISTKTISGHGKLASPLLPVQPLLSYRALLALPDRVPQLLRAIAGLQAEVFAEQAVPLISTSISTSTTSRATGTPTGATVTGGGDVSVVGTCCGSTADQRHAVGDLTTISWLLAMPVRPAVRAALYRAAATLPGVRYDGPTRDPLGRRGVGVSVGSGNDQLLMIFDDRTGALLSTSVGFGTSAIRHGDGDFTVTLQTATVVASKHVS